MSNQHKTKRLDRRTFLKSSAAIGGSLAVGSPFTPVWAAAPLLKVDSRTLEVNKKAAKVFGIVGTNGKSGILATEGDRFAGSVLNASSSPLQLHWHGQVKAPADQDRARPDGTPCVSGATDAYDFELTPGTHWMHSHSLTEQQLLAAPEYDRVIALGRRRVYPRDCGGSRLWAAAARAPAARGGADWRGPGLAGLRALVRTAHTHSPAHPGPGHGPAAPDQRRVSARDGSAFHQHSITPLSTPYVCISRKDELS